MGLKGLHALLLSGAGRLTTPAEKFAVAEISMQLSRQPGCRAERRAKTSRPGAGIDERRQPRTMHDRAASCCRGGSGTADHPELTGPSGRKTTGPTATNDRRR